MKAKSEKEAAKRRIRELFEQAHEALHDKGLGKEYADRYVSLARKIAMKSKVRIPSELKRRFCKSCYSYLEPGINARKRLKEGRIVVLCENCRHIMRFPYSKEQKEKKKEQNIKIQ